MRDVIRVTIFDSSTTRHLLGEETLGWGMQVLIGEAGKVEAEVEEESIWVGRGQGAGVVEETFAEDIWVPSLLTLA